MVEHSYAKHVVAHDVSVTLGGNLSLFPVNHALTQAYARTIRTAIERAEQAAYEQGIADAQAAMRKMLGMK